MRYSYRLVVRSLPVLLSILLTNTGNPDVLPPAAQASANHAAWYSVLQHPASLWALDIDDNGDGWIAAGSGTANALATEMVRLADGKLSDTISTFPNTTLVELALSADGKTGWALGNGTQQNPRAVLVHLENGHWTELKDPTLNKAVHSLSDMVLDDDARNGWAIGLSDLDDVHSTVVLQLQEGKWSVANVKLPTNVGLVHIAADATLEHVWAGGFDENDDGALLYLSKGAFVPVKQAIGHYVVFDLGVAADGSGWAGLDTNDEPANSPSPSGFIHFAADGTWKLVQSNTLALSEQMYFSRIEVEPGGNGWAFGNRLGVGSGSPPLVILSLQDDRIVGYQYPRGDEIAGAAQQQPLFGQATDLAMGPQGTAWAVTFEGSILRYGLLPAGGAFPSPAPRLDGNERCFQKTGQCLHGEFLKFWNGNGDLVRFGMPVTGELYERLEDGKVYMVQYTERARLEFHDESKDVKYRVLLGLLGNKLAEDRQAEAPFMPITRTATITFFPQTAHSLSGPIGDYWQKGGGLPVFGYPISEAFQEKSPTDGKTYLVQYFERNRLEYHPEATDPNFRVQLGLLGVQQYQEVYGRLP